MFFVLSCLLYCLLPRGGITSAYWPRVRNPYWLSLPVVRDAALWNQRRHILSCWRTRLVAGTKWSQQCKRELAFGDQFWIHMKATKHNYSKVFHAAAPAVRWGRHNDGQLQCTKCQPPPQRCPSEMNSMPASNNNQLNYWAAHAIKYLDWFVWLEYNIYIYI